MASAYSFFDFTGTLDMNSLKNVLSAMSVVMARPMAMLNVLPYLNKTIVPGTTHVTTTFALMTPIMVLFVPTMIEHPLFWDQLLIVLAKEAFIGMLIGFIGGMPFWLAENIGFMIDNQRGTTMASVFNPLAGDSTSPLGIFMNVVAIALFFATGGFIVFLALFYGSYLIWPIENIIPTFDDRYVNFFLGVGDHLLRATALYAAPMLILMFLSDFGLGMMNRFAQQLNVFTISMPVKSAVAFFVLMLYMGLLFGFLKDEFTTSYVLIEQLQHVLR